MINFTDFLTEFKKPQEIERLLSELPKTITSSTEWKRSNIDTYMGRYGWKRIGQGGWARVYGHPSKSYVIKIYSNDEQYDTYLDFMKRNQSNKYVPKIIGRPFSFDNGLSVVRMEFLTKVTKEQFYEFLELKTNPDKQDADFKKIMTFIDRHAEFEDMSEHNVMMKGNQIKVVDPLAGFD